MASQPTPRSFDLDRALRDLRRAMEADLGRVMQRARGYLSPGELRRRKAAARLRRMQGRR